MNKESLKMDKRYSKHSNISMLAVIKSESSDSNNQVGGNLADNIN